MSFKPQDHYFKQAKKEGYKARSIFKLEEIDQKYSIFDKNVRTVLDIGCAPGSWLQYAHDKLSQTRAGKQVALPQDRIVIGFDIKDVDLQLPGLYTYNQDIQDIPAVEKILASHKITKFDAIISDMAPNTIGFRDIDALRSVELLRMTLPLYEHFLKEGGKAVIKIFMGPGFEEFLKDFKAIVGSKNVKVFKPAACRKESKETFIVKW